LKRIFLLTMLLTTLMIPFASAAKMTVYENQDYHFSFAYPADWDFITYKRDETIVFSAFFLQSTNVNVGVIVYPPDLQIKKNMHSEKRVKSFVKEEMERIKKKVPNAQLNSFSVVDLKSEKAILLKTSIPNRLIDETYIVFTDNYRYDFYIAGTSEGLSDYRSILDESLESFEIH